MSRRLLVTIRNTPSGSSNTYSELWRRLRTAVLETGGRAWRFHSSDDTTRHCEFIEWSAADHPASLIENPHINHRLHELDAIGTVSSRHLWEESPP